MEQIKKKFDHETIKKIITGAMIAGGGVALTVILQNISNMDFGDWTPVVVGICSIGINIIREYNKGV